MKTVLFSLLLISSAHAEIAKSPTGWFLYEPKSGEYTVGRDAKVTHSGKASGVLFGAIPNPTSYGSLMQLFKADSYRGKRVRLSGFVRSQEVTRWAGLWMRIDGPDRDPKRFLALDTMENRPISGTTNWTRYDVVLDVAPEASQIAIGVGLYGPGHVWLDDVVVEEVDRNVPVTGGPHALPDRPQNLSFEN